jgi:hypothetical protein
MTSAKQLFLGDRKLSDELRAVVKQTWFEKCLAFADAELINLPGLTPDKLNGAREYKRILLTLADVDEDKIQTYPPILDQTFDQLPPNRQPGALAKAKAEEINKSSP